MVSILRTVAVLLLLQCTFAVRSSAPSSSSYYPPLFESTLKFLGETMQWESNETVDRANVLPEYDFVVVGAGSAGSVVASRLSEVSTYIYLINAYDVTTYICVLHYYRYYRVENFTHLRMFLFILYFAESRLRFAQLFFFIFSHRYILLA